MDFEQVYNENWNYVYSICYGFFHNKADAEDAAQDSFIKVSRKLHQFEGRAKLTSWLYRIAYNTCLMRLRDSKAKMRDGLSVCLTAVDLEITVSSSPIVFIDVSNALKKLAPGYKQVLKQHILKGLTHEEISHASGTSEGCAKSQFWKARKRMKESLQGYN